MPFLLSLNLILQSSLVPSVLTTAFQVMPQALPFLTAVPVLRQPSPLNTETVAVSVGRAYSRMRTHSI